MEKTAITQAIDYVKDDLKLSGYEHPEIIRVLELLLQTEKEQIIDAWADGLHKGYSGDPGSAGKYYSDTFKKSGE